MSFIHNNIEFHNVAALEQRPGASGLLLPRFPRTVRDILTPYGRIMAPLAAGVELRFVSEGTYADLLISAHGGACEVDVFRGDFFMQTVRVGDAPQVLRLAAPDNFARVDAHALAGRFSPKLWRLVGDGAGALVFHNLDALGAQVRPPRPEEKPSRTWLAYGSSITHGHKRSYIQHAARRLKVDLLNKGLSGSCYCESEVADYLADGCQWDFATLELGVNMVGEVPTPEFERRARHLLSRLIGAHPGKPIHLITIFPLGSDYMGPDDSFGQRAAEYRDVLRQIAGQHSRNNVRLIEGRDVLSDLAGLTTDLVHPSDFGYAEMADNLARILSQSAASRTRQDK